MRHSQNNRTSSESGETDDSRLDPPDDTTSTVASTRLEPEFSRRGYLGLVGVGGSVLTAGCASSIDDDQSAADQPAGFGLDAYGLSAYGGVVTDDHSDSVSEPDEDADDTDEESEADHRSDESIIESLPNVLTVKANTTATSATLWGLVWTLGECDSVDISFEYRRTGADEWKETETSTLSNWGAFDQMASNLCPSTEYEYRAVVQTKDGAEVGDTSKFRTLEGDHDN